jgi:hypothetical protein
MGGNSMSKIGRMVGVLALALAALPALATNEDGMAGAAQGDVEAAAAESQAAPMASAEPASGSVARASFTTQVVDREPQDEITSLPSDVSEILFFTELSGLTGHTVTHLWEHEGSELARVPFQVQGSRWRVHSTKQLQPGWVGSWTVSVVDEDGTVLRSESFEYVAAAESEAEATAAAAEPPAPAEPDAAAQPAPPAALE